MRILYIIILITNILNCSITTVSSQNTFLNHIITTILFRQNDIPRLNELDIWVTEKNQNGWQPFDPALLNTYLGEVYERSFLEQNHDTDGVYWKELTKEKFFGRDNWWTKTNTVNKSVLDSKKNCFVQVSFELCNKRKYIILYGPKNSTAIWDLPGPTVLWVKQELFKYFPAIHNNEKSNEKNY